MEQEEIKSIELKIENLYKAVLLDINHDLYVNYNTYRKRYNELLHSVSHQEWAEDTVSIADVPNRDKGTINSPSPRERTKLYEIKQNCELLLEKIRESKKYIHTSNPIDLNDRTADDQKRLSIEKITIFIVGLCLIVVLLFITFIYPEPTPFQYTIFRIIIALASAGFAALIPGFITVNVKNWIRASGAIAVFIAVYFFNPATLLSQRPNDTNVKSEHGTLKIEKGNEDKGNSNATTSNKTKIPLKQKKRLPNKY